MNLKRGGLATFGVVCSSWTRINGILACISIRQESRKIISANAATKPFPAVHTSGRSKTNPLGHTILGCAQSIISYLSFMLAPSCLRMFCGPFRGRAYVAAANKMVSRATWLYYVCAAVLGVSFGMVLPNIHPPTIY